MPASRGERSRAPDAEGREASAGKRPTARIKALDGATPDPPTATFPVLASPALSGREAERAQLIAALSAAVPVIVVEGEAGIGKTRLVGEALADRASGVDRLRVLTARCPAVEMPFPLGAVVDALRRAVDDPADTLRQVSPIAGALRPLLPEWSDYLPPASEPVEDAAAERHRVFRAIAEVIAALRVDVLVAEDVHWADDPTVELLLFLASERIVRLIVTWRPEDVHNRSLLGRLARLAAGSDGLRLSLAPLDSAATTRLAESMLGADLPGWLVAELHRRTAGVPLLVEESVRLVHSQGGWPQPDKRPGRGHAAAPWSGVPPSVSDMVRERADRLGADARAVLWAAAVLAAPADEQELATVAELEPNAATDGLAAALASGLLVEERGGLVAYRHALLADAVGEQIPGPRRRLLHARACMLLESRIPLPLARLARHAREAGDTARWLLYGEQAADVALATGDDATSESVLSELICGAGAPAEDLVRLVTKFPFAALTGDDRYRGIAQVLRATLRGQLDERTQADLRWQLARVLTKSDETAAACAEMELAIPHLGHDPAAAGRAMISLAQLSWADWPTATRLDWLRRGAQLMAVGSPLDRLDLTVDRAVALLRFGEDDGWVVAAEIPRTTDDPRQRVRIARGLGNVGHFAVAWGRYDLARELLDTACELAERYGYGRLLSGFQVTALRLDYLTGRWTGLAERAARLADSALSSPGVRLEAELVAGLLESAAGRYATATAALRKVRDELHNRGIRELVAEAAAAVARLELIAGRPAEALAASEQPVPTATGLDSWVSSAELLAVRVRALVELGRLDEAGSVVAACRQAVGHHNAPAAIGALTLADAILAEGHGGRDLATERFAAAADWWQRLPRPYDELLARERQARCLLEDDEQAGCAVLVETLRGLTKLGAAGDVDRLVGLLRRHGIETRGPGWRGGRTGYGNRLSPRETEVVRLVIDGHTNREIAEILFRSVRTVETQVRSAMRKLDVSSRTALAVRAAEMDLSEPGGDG